MPLPAFTAPALTAVLRHAAAPPALLRACASSGPPLPSPPPPTAADLRARYAISMPADPVRAAAVARAHAGPALCRWAAARPLADHTRAAFARVAAWRAAQPAGRPLVLDAGCGTGRSSEGIARAFPGWDVVGVDRNPALVSKSVSFGGERGAAARGKAAPPAPPNLLVVRADQVDFLRLAAAARWRLRRVYLLYPSPYPKRAGLRSRLYGGPVFPLLMSLLEEGGDIEVRANWKAYMIEFAAAARELAPAATVDGPHQFEIGSADDALTNFEAKYHACGTPIFKMRIQV